MIGGRMKQIVLYYTAKLNEQYGLKKDFEDCLWWVANYNGIKNYEEKCIIPYTVHQYFHKRYVEGFYGFVDCNRFSKGKTVEDLKIKKAKKCGNQLG
jgi:GH25 family lysozyme M1 (1,4-beta-N-acetylmuramidase)